MLRIGFTRLNDGAAQVDAEKLRAVGCQVVRAAEPGQENQALTTILDFIGVGDELVVVRLDRIARSSRGLLDVLDRLETRGAVLKVLEPELATDGFGGQTLRAVLEAVSGLEYTGARGRRTTNADADTILALQRTGVGPVEIARRLGVSRMTVWRKLKALDTAGA